jgi:hypothetical protein
MSFVCTVHPVVIKLTPVVAGSVVAATLAVPQYETVEGPTVQLPNE